MAHKKHICKPGYPLPDYNGHTTDDKRCPRCGSEELTLMGGSMIKSGQRIGICAECGENFVVEPPSNKVETQQVEFDLIDTGEARRGYDYAYRMYQRCLKLADETKNALWIERTTYWKERAAIFGTVLKAQSRFSHIQSNGEDS